METEASGIGDPAVSPIDVPPPSSPTALPPSLLLPTPTPPQSPIPLTPQSPIPLARPIAPREMQLVHDLRSSTSNMWRVRRGIGDTRINERLEAWITSALRGLVTSLSRMSPERYPADVLNPNVNGFVLERRLFGPFSIIENDTPQIHTEDPLARAALREADRSGGLFGADTHVFNCDVSSRAYDLVLRYLAKKLYSTYLMESQRTQLDKMSTVIAENTANIIMRALANEPYKWTPEKYLHP